MLSSLSLYGSGRGIQAVTSYLSFILSVHHPSCVKYNVVGLFAPLIITINSAAYLFLRYDFINSSSFGSLSLTEIHLCSVNLKFLASVLMHSIILSAPFPLRLSLDARQGMFTVLGASLILFVWAFLHKILLNHVLTIYCSLLLYLFNISFV